MKKLYIIISALFICIIAGGLVYSDISNNETFEPNYPKNFDTLVIEYSDIKWIVARDKKVDKFICKSNRVSEHIGEGTDFYILRFMLDGKQVYSIPYDEIGYPKGAIKIMRELMEENKRE